MFFEISFSITLTLNNGCFPFVKPPTKINFNGLLNGFTRIFLISDFKYEAVKNGIIFQDGLYLPLHF